MRNLKSFTLIELLIVVAIIAILAAIAVPNFLEAQVRSKVSRVKADFRSLATGIETYRVDWNKYPFDVPSPQYLLSMAHPLTTPQAYFSNISLVDPFVPVKLSGQNLNGYQYYNAGPSGATSLAYTYGSLMPNWGDFLTNLGTTSDPPYVQAAIIVSFGPDAGKGPWKGDDGGEWVVFGLDYEKDGTIGSDRVYDPTNGTVSWGDIIRIVGEQMGTPYRP